MRCLLRFAVLVLPIIFLAAPAAHAVVFTATLDGPSEFPPSPSSGTGFAVVDFDLIAHTLHVVASFSGLTGNTTAAHIHCCVDPGAPTPTAAVATALPTFPGFPLVVTAGSYEATFDSTLASTYSAAFITARGGTVAAAEAALFAAMLAGDTYFNIHTTFRPGGEIRGFLTQVPAPGALALLVAGLAGLGVAVRMRRG